MSEGSRAVQLQGIAPTVTASRAGPKRTGHGYYWTVIQVELERVEGLELLAMVLAHLNHAEASGELSPRVPMLMTLRDKLATGLREEQ